LLAVLLTLRKVTGEEAWFVPKVIASSFLGIGLIGALYMAIGCFASSLTRSQIIAAMTSFLLGVSLWVLSLRTLLPNPDATLLDQFLGHLSLLRHMEDFVRGIVDARHVVFYITGILFFLFLTQRVVESRRWK
jgi:ABC-2 type transport system permease protein